MYIFFEKQYLASKKIMNWQLLKYQQQTLAYVKKNKRAKCTTFAVFITLFSEE